MKSDSLNGYFDFVCEKINTVRSCEEQNIQRAAQYIAESCMNGGRLYVFGTGHSHIIAEELYLRAGGLALIEGILPPEMMLHQKPNKSTYLERVEGYSEAYMQLHDLSKKDTLFVISNSGRNAVPVEMCLLGKKIGCKTIALTSLKHSLSAGSRHSSGKRICDIADVTIDNHGEVGDAAFYVDNFDIPTGPTSDIVGTTIAQALIVVVIDILVKNGFTPPVFKSSNVDGSDEFNSILFKKYYS